MPPAEVARLYPLATERELRLAAVEHRLNLGALHALAFADEYPHRPEEGETGEAPEADEKGASVREAAADALSDDRVSSDLRAAVEAYRDAVVAMLIEADDRDEKTDELVAVVNGCAEALRATPSRSIADVRCKLALLLPEILPDLNGAAPTAFLENVFDDVERLADAGRQEADPVHAVIAAARHAEAAMGAFERETTSPSNPTERERENALDAASAAARHAVWRTVPTSPEGRQALVAFVAFVGLQGELAYGSDWRTEVHRDMLGEAILALMAAIEAEGTAPALDLSGVSIRGLARFYDHLQSLAHIASTACNAPMAWDAERVHHSPLGSIMEAEADRLDGLAAQVAAEIRTRTPGSETERDDRLATLGKRELSLIGGFEDKALLADLAAAWGA